MKKLVFSKMQALGNDFVVVDALECSVELTRQQIMLMADRKYGIGFDQLLLLESPGDDSSVDCLYRIFNADGSEVAQCGNGARCVGLYLYNKEFNKKESWVLKTKNSVLVVNKCADMRYSVQVPAPQFSLACIPMLYDQERLFYDIKYQGKVYQFGAVNVGNPHMCLFEEGGQALDHESMGRVLSANECFPEGVNVGFLELENRHRIKLTVYERGAGMTLACGSGACAAMAIARRLNRVENIVRVIQKGGELEVEWVEQDESDDFMLISGRADNVFTGVFHLD
jgi:diaminopimelate epimerase